VLKRIISVSILLLTSVFAVWQVKLHYKEAIFPFVILFTVVSILIWLLSHKNSDLKNFSFKWSRTILHLLLSAAATAFIFINWDFVLFDDAGFLLRYLQNFSKGYFYAFNPQDGPVFGISSFSYGLINGILCMAHIVTPDQSIVVTGIVGLFFICFLLLKILERYGMNPMQLMLSFLIVLFSSKFFLNSMTTGMETPVHMAIVMSAIYFFVKEKSKMMWLMLTISVISKLDAVPLALALGSIHLFQSRKNLFPFSWKNKTLREVTLFCLLPLTTWVIFAFAIFGSPLPQSAYSKIYFHYHAGEHWFPFLRYFIENDFRIPVFYAFLLLFIVHIFLVTRGKNSVRTLAFGFGFISTMILYYFYNPIEQMTWYYAMPDFFLLAQTVVSFYFIAEYFFIPAFKPYAWSLLFIGAGIFLFLDTYYGRTWMKNFLDYTENERITIGKYVATITNERDTVIAQHGHISRYTKAYVIDMTGLNSKLSTQYKNNIDSVTRKFKPHFIVTHGLDYILNSMDSNNYVLVKSFYDICENGWPAFRIFKRNSGDERHVQLIVPADNLIKCYDRKWDFGIPVAMDKNVQIVLPYDSAMRAVSFGIKRKENAFDLQIALFAEGKIIQQQKFPVESKGYTAKATSRNSKEIIFMLNDTSRYAVERHIEITDTQGDPITVIEPLYHVDSKNESLHYTYYFKPESKKINLQSPL
jgi:hypothetical protein